MVAVVVQEGVVRRAIYLPAVRTVAFFPSWCLGFGAVMGLAIVAWSADAGGDRVRMYPSKCPVSLVKMTVRRQRVGWPWRATLKTYPRDEYFYNAASTMERVLLFHYRPRRSVDGQGSV